MSELHWKTHMLETGIVEQCISMSYNENMENDKNHTVEHIRWVSYTEKHISLETDVEQCISMSYNENMENDKNTL